MGPSMLVGPSMAITDDEDDAHTIKQRRHCSPRNVAFHLSASRREEDILCGYTRHHGRVFNRENSSLVRTLPELRFQSNLERITLPWTVSSMKRLAKCEEDNPQCQARTAYTQPHTQPTQQLDWIVEALKTHLKTLGSGCPQNEMWHLYLKAIGSESFFKY